MVINPVTLLDMDNDSAHEHLTKLHTVKGCFGVVVVCAWGTPTPFPELLHKWQQVDRWKLTKAIASVIQCKNLTNTRTL